MSREKWEKEFEEKSSIDKMVNSIKCMDYPPPEFPDEITPYSEPYYYENLLETTKIQKSSL